MRVLEMIALGRPVPEVLEALVRAVERQSADGMIGSVLLLDAEGKRLRHGAAPGLPAVYCAAIDGLEIGPQVGSCGTAAHTGRRVIVSDIRSDPLWAAFRELAAAHDLRACWSTPIKSRTGKVLGTFAMYYREPRAPSAADLELIERTEHLAGIVLERDRADVALRDAESHLRMIFDTLPLAMGHIDREERYVTVNLGMEALLERSRDEVEGRTVREVLGEAAYEVIRPHIATVLQGREVSFERSRNRPDGSTIWLRVQYVPRSAAEGVKGYFVLLTDITEQKRAEIAAREGEARFRALTNLSSDWYWEQDAAFRFTVLSGPGAAALADGEVSKYLGTTRWGSGDLEPLEGDWAAHRAMLEQHQPFHEVVLRRRFADGSDGYMAVSGEPLFAADRRFAGYRGVAKNVTDRVRAAQALRESEERFRSLSKLSSDFYWETDSEHRFKALADESALKRGNSDRAVGKTAWEIPSVHPSEEGWRAHKGLMDRHLPFRDFEFARQIADGEVHWYSVSGEPVFDAAGNFTRYRGVGHEVTDRKLAEHKLERLAHYDELTGLPNRAMLQDRLAQGLLRAKRSETLLAVMFLDLDRFKEVNDSLGHAVGDELLQSVAGRLAGCLRTTDTVARLGGDEFTVLLEGVRNVEEIDSVARKILAAMTKPLRAGGHELFVSASVGVTIYPLDDQDRDTLLKNADMAMYHAKQEGRNNVQYFSPEMGVRSGRKLDLTTHLRHAIERGEFEPHYQPIVEIVTGRICGLEALIRWRNADLGMVSPAQFIPIAEDTGLIVPIGEWMLRAVCKQMAVWRRAGCAPGYVAVNLSPRQFRQDDLVDVVARVLRESRVPARSLELEVTEGTIMHRTEEAIVSLRRLRRLGVRIAIDDFGTGYSSLAYLQRFPVHTLKVDQSFVRDIRSDKDQAAIVTAVIGLARSLKLTALAEGVETREQLAFLKANGCDRYQGYFYSRPVAAQDVEVLLRKQGRARAVARPRRLRSGPSRRSSPAR